MEDAQFRPKPGSLPGRKGGRPNLIVGGQGTPRSFRIAARYADEFNIRPALSGTLIGRDRDEVRRRERDLLAALGAGDAGEAWFEPRRARWIHGTPAEARATVGRYEEAGVQRMVLQDFLPRDLEMIDLAAETFLG